MKVKELIETLQKFNGELEVTISDGHNLYFYHTNDCEFNRYINDDRQYVLDIGIGGNKLDI